jgi:hypothetical protein
VTSGASPVLICQRALADIGTRSSIEGVDLQNFDNGLALYGTESAYCGLYYAGIKDHILRAANWNFAKRTAQLTLWKALPGTPENPTPATVSGWSPLYPAPPWVYSYVYPPDCLRARALIGQPQQVPIAPPIFSGSAGTNPPISQRLPMARFEIASDFVDANGAPLTIPQIVVLTQQEFPLLEYTFEDPPEVIWDAMFEETMIAALAARLAQVLTGDKALANAKYTLANEHILNARTIDANEGLTVIDHMPDWLQVRGAGGGLGYEMFFYPLGPLFPIAPLI